MLYKLNLAAISNVGLSIYNFGILFLFILQQRKLVLIWLAKFIVVTIRLHFLVLRCDISML